MDDWTLPEDDSPKDWRDEWELRTAGASSPSALAGVAVSMILDQLDDIRNTLMRPPAQGRLLTVQVMRGEEIAATIELRMDADIQVGEYIRLLPDPALDQPTSFQCIVESREYDFRRLDDPQLVVYVREVES